MGPVGPAHVLSGARRAGGEPGPVGGVDEPGLPGVVTFGRERGLPVKPGDGAQERLLLPLPRRVPCPGEELRLDDSPLERLPDVVLLRRRPGETAGAPLVVGEHAVDRVALDRCPGLVDGDGVARVCLPDEVAELELRVGGAIAEPAFEDLGGAAEILAITQVEIGRDPARTRMRAPVVGTLLMGL